jgi:tetratricopeptide (TPR) repeat protein
VTRTNPRTKGLSIGKWDANGNPMDAHHRRRTQLFRIAVLTGVLVIAVWSVVLRQRPSNIEHLQTRDVVRSDPTYVGAERCAACHAKAADAWRLSHHAQAMQQANGSTVLGNFRNGRFAKDGVTSSFYSKDGEYYVRTDGSDGTIDDFPVAYTFGIFPLQQYLVPFPNGRLQSLGLAWDSRSTHQGGQRWFHLYPDQKMPHTDPLHWTGRNQTWNFMCAECHSTNLRKNYDLEKDSYTTTWSDINVSCESCHGPGSNHVTWAQMQEKNSDSKRDSTKGLTVQLRSSRGEWQLDESSNGTMHWKGEPRPRTELETCAPCHSRRHPMQSDYRAGEPFLDAYVPSLLDEGVYFADGQIQEEDYEYGSFVQSKMYAEGVTCSDCHNPHSLSFPSTDLNSICGQCHSLVKFGAPEHHHHKESSAGALCVNCHMPTRTYMVTDVRRDHSFRVPRPDFSIAYGTPNACSQCHSGKSAQWAEDAVSAWYGPSRQREPHFVEALDAGRRGLPEAETLLASLITDFSKPAIARATALSLLPRYLSPASLSAVRTSLADGDALVRIAAVRALQPLPQEERIQLAAPLLRDPLRSVRIEVARLLAGSPPELLQASQKAALDSAVSERIESEMVSAERPESHMNLGLLYMQMGRMKDAEHELQTALRLEPGYVPAMVNLADLYRVQQRETEAQQVLEKALALAPDAAEPIYALGLLKARLGRQHEALDLFAEAVRLQPGTTLYAYVYGVALHSYGEVDKAIEVLKKAHDKSPSDREVLVALITFQRDKGDVRSAVAYADKLAQLSPGNAQVIALRNSLNQPQ